MNDEELFEKASGLKSGQQAKFLRDNCEDDSQLDRVSALLSADQTPDSLLDTTAMQSMDVTVASSNLPKSIGDFEILGELGRGGMGVVYEARQKSLKRKVALKVLSSGLGLSSKAILRFRREAEAAGKLHHTNIVPIYTTGEDKGIHFYAMELIDGPSLDQVIKIRSKTFFAGIKDRNSPDLRAGSHAEADENDASAVNKKSDAADGFGEIGSSISTSSGSTYFDTVATMIADVAEALDHAHEHGVIHRDVKPSNLLLGPDGRLSINDFGLARMLEQPGMTVSGEFVGSPLYMSPEQITAGRVQLDHRTDIYSLGATLYELLAHQPPFPGQTRDQVLSQILHKEPSSPRKIDRSIPLDLDTICMKAIDKDPDRRYQTAAQLADDLRKYVNRHAISARRVGPIGKTLKLARRNVALSLVCALLMTALVYFGIDYRSRSLQKADDLKTDVIGFAFRGDFDAANDLLRKNENRFPKGWHALLEGLVLMLDGDPTAANDRFVEAESKLSGENEALSLLAISSSLSGKEDDYILLLRKVSLTEENTFLQKLLKGYALHWFGTAKSQELLDEAVKKRPSNILARRFRGEALVWHALDRRDREVGLQLAMQAHEDLVLVTKTWPENQSAKQHLTRAEIALAIINRDLGNPVWETQISDAEKRLRMMDSRVTQEIAHSTHLAIHLAKQNEEAFVREVLENKAEVTDSKRSRIGYFEVQIPTLVFGCEQLPPSERVRLSLQFHDLAPQKLRNLTHAKRIFIETENRNVDRVDLLESLTRDLESRLNQHSGIYLHLDWVALRLLHANDRKVREVALRIRDGYDKYLIDQHRELGLAVTDFLLGKKTESQARAIVHSSRGLTSLLEFTIGVHHLANGNRFEAKRCFDRSFSQGFHTYYAPKWSRAFSRRVADETWLPWCEPQGNTP